MNTRQILLEIWRYAVLIIVYEAHSILLLTQSTSLYRNEGLEGLFRGVGPRVGRAGPSVGIVVSSYEVVKYIYSQKTLNH
jgi:Mitochondrial carrier protein